MLIFGKRGEQECRMGVSKMTTPPTLAWAIKAPDGEMLFAMFTEDTALIEIQQITGKLWRDCLTEGYRCVRVEVREVGEG
jgi:hypothetical protein